MAIFAAIVAISTGAWAQDDPEAALRKAKEAREKCERLLAGVEDATVLGHASFVAAKFAWPASALRPDAGSSWARRNP